MKKRYFISGVIFILIILTLVFVGQDTQTERVCIETEKCFSVTLAETLEEKHIGLSQTSFLAENEGMLFVYQKPLIPGFWMKDMSFPIDIIWIDEKLEIVGFEENIQPCLDKTGESCEIYSPEKEILYVLETNGNLSEMYGFEIGDKIILNI